MLSAYELRVIMFGPTASPVVHCHSTGHIGPTTCVLTPRSLARVDRDASPASTSQSRIEASSDSLQPARPIADAASGQTKHDAPVKRSCSPYVRTVLAASAPRVIDAVRPPSVCASGTCTVSGLRPV